MAVEGVDTGRQSQATDVTASTLSRFVIVKTRRGVSVRGFVWQGQQHNCS
jgi:hypothetical protein